MTSRGARFDVYDDFTLAIPPAVKTLVIEMAPAKRLLDTLRFREFKLRDDREVWAGAVKPLETKLEEGWRLMKVVLDWGRSMPLTPEKRDQAAREMLHCLDGACMMEHTISGYGRGRVTCYLERDA